MSKTEEIVSWVVYRRTLYRSVVGGVAICEQSEWDEMELANPSYHTLIKAGIASEVEAEKLARRQPGVTPEPTVRLKARV